MPDTNPADIRTLIDPDTLRILDRMADREFMKPVIDYGDCWECETSNGEGFTVPADVHSIPDEYPNGWQSDGAGMDEDSPLCMALAQYMPEGCSGEVASATVRRGVYLCRLSAPGYMDCTDWEAHDTAQSAADSLAEHDSGDDSAD